MQNKLDPQVLFQICLKAHPTEGDEKRFMELVCENAETFLGKLLDKQFTLVSYAEAKVAFVSFLLSELKKKSELGLLLIELSNGFYGHLGSELRETFREIIADPKMFLKRQGYKKEAAFIKDVLGLSDATFSLYLNSDLTILDLLYAQPTVIFNNS